MIANSVTGAIQEQVNLEQAGENSILVDVSTYTSGIYWYSLVIDGTPVAIKKLAVIK